MKQFVVSIFLAIFLVGCSEKPKFSINEADTLETYANNPVFVKPERRADPVGADGKGMIIYQFLGVPMSVYDINTSDLDVLGGSIYMIKPMAKSSNFAGSSPGQNNIILTIKGKQNFNKLVDRLTQLKDFTCQKVETGNDKIFQCMMGNSYGTNKLSVSYNSLSDIVSFNYMKSYY